MNNETKAVDVLRTLLGEGYADYAEREKAIARVEDALNAATLCALYLTPVDDQESDELYVVRARYVHDLRAALARCGGAK